MTFLIYIFKKPCKKCVFWDKIALKLTIDQLNEFMPLLEQAKAMHKNEIIESWHNGYNTQSPMIDEENCGE